MQLSEKLVGNIVSINEAEFGQTQNDLDSTETNSLLLIFKLTWSRNNHNLFDRCKKLESKLLDHHFLLNKRESHNKAHHISWKKMIEAKSGEMKKMYRRNEEYPRRSRLRIFGVKKNIKESPEETVIYVATLIKVVIITHIDCSHRIKSKPMATAVPDGNNEMIDRIEIGKEKKVKKCNIIAEKCSYRIR